MKFFFRTFWSPSNLVRTIRKKLNHYSLVENEPSLIFLSGESSTKLFGEFSRKYPSSYLLGLENSSGDAQTFFSSIFLSFSQVFYREFLVKWKPFSSAIRVAELTIENEFRRINSKEKYFFFNTPENSKKNIFSEFAQNLKSENKKLILIPNNKKELPSRSAIIGRVSEIGNVVGKFRDPKIRWIHLWGKEGVGKSTVAYGVKMEYLGF
jgi:hypothetical protein